MHRSDVLNNSKSIRFLRKCMHAMIQNTRVWKTRQDYSIITEAGLTSQRYEELSIFV